MSRQLDRPYRIWCVAVCLLVLVVGAVNAQGAADDDAEPEITVQETVEVEGRVPERSRQSSLASRLPVPPQRVPLSLSTVDRERFSEQGARTLSQALDNAAGVNVQTGSSTFDFFFMRGFDSVSSSLILLDGALETESPAYPLYNVERVEVLRGPGGFLYGGRALAGAVNLVRKQPTAGSFLNLGFEAGSYDAFQGTVDANIDLPQHRFGLRVNGLWSDEQGFRDRNERQSWAVNPALAWRTQGGTLVSLNLEAARFEVEPDTGIPVLGDQLAEVPRDRSYSLDTDMSEQRISRVQLDIEHAPRGRWRFREKLYFSSLDWDSTGTLLVGVQPNAMGGLDVARTQTALDNRQDFFGLQAEAATEFSTGSLRHHLLVGLELSRLEDDFSLDVALLSPVDIFNPQEPPFPFAFPLPSQQRLGEATSTVVAPFVLDRVQLNEQLELLLGLRFDDVDYDASGTSSSRSDSELSPMVGLVYSPKEDLSFYLQRGESFEPPSTLVLGAAEPEEGEQWELGLRAQLAGGRWQSHLALFELEKSNLAIPDATGITRQQGDQRSRGLELELRGKLGAFDASFAYAYTDAELLRFSQLVVIGPGPADFVVLDRSGNDPAFAPEHLARLWLSRPLGAKLRLGGGLRFVGEQFIAEDNGFAIDDVLLIDAALLGEVGSMKWQLNLRNLSDEDYETRAFGVGAVAPAPGFEAQVAVRWQL